MTEDGSWSWLASTRELQERTYGFSFPLEGEDLANYLTWNHTAAVLELGEAMQEVQWKPWATPRGPINRDAFIKELVDALHFIGNALVAVDCTDEELETAYQAKQDVNRRRQATGYDGRNKCPRCRRAYDDDTTACYAAHTDEVGREPAWCAEVGWYVGTDGSNVGG